MPRFGDLADGTPFNLSTPFIKTVEDGGPHNATSMNDSSIGLSIPDDVEVELLTAVLDYFRDVAVGKSFKTADGEFWTKLDENGSATNVKTGEGVNFSPMTNVTILQD